MLGDEARGLVDQLADLGLLFGLHRAEMPLRQADLGMARQRAEHGNPDLAERVPHEILMARAGDAIEHNAGKLQSGAIIAEARGDSRRRLRLSGRVDHQHHGPAQHLCDIGGGAGAGNAAGGDAVEQAHRALGEHDIGIHAAADEMGDCPAVHRPAVDVDGGAARGCGVEGGIDVIRTALEALHVQSAMTPGACERQRQRGLADAGGRCGDDEACRHHEASGKRGSAPTGR